jgi:hypothetical protein
MFVSVDASAGCHLMLLLLVPNLQLLLLRAMPVLHMLPEHC